MMAGRMATTFVGNETIDAIVCARPRRQLRLGHPAKVIPAGVHASAVRAAGACCRKCWQAK